MSRKHDVLTKAEGEKAESACAGIQASYDKEVNDEFVFRSYVEKDGKTVATIQDGDSDHFLLTSVGPCKRDHPRILR